MEIRKEIIKNYYDRHGSFEGVERCSAYNVVTQNIPAEQIETSLFRCLGYGPISNDLHPLNEKQHHDLRVAVLKEDESGVKKLGFSSLEDAKSFIDKNSFSLITVRTVKESKYDKVIEALSEYFRYSEQLVKSPFVENGMHRLSDAIKMLGTTKTQHKAVSEFKSLNPELIKFEKSENVKVVGGICYCPFKLSEQSKNNIIHHALLKAAKPLGIPSSILKEVLNPFADVISENSLKAYLRLLEYGEANNYTYAQVLDKLGYSVPDFEKSYNSLGVIVVKMNDSVSLVLSQSFNPETQEPFLQITRESNDNVRAAIQRVKE